MHLFTLTSSGVHPSLRGVLAPPPDALTAEGYDMTFGTNVLGESVYAASRTQQRYPDVLNDRTLLLYGTTYPSVGQSFHPRTQVQSRQPLFTDGNSRCLTLWFWAGFLDLQGVANEEKDVRLYVVWAK